MGPRIKNINIIKEKYWSFLGNFLAFKCIPTVKVRVLIQLDYTRSLNSSEKSNNKNSVQLKCLPVKGCHRYINALTKRELTPSVIKSLVIRSLVKN